MNTSRALDQARRVAFAAIAAVLVAGCGATAEQDRAAIERDILSTPGSKELWGAIKREYPEDFAVLVDRVQALDFVERRDPEKGEAIGKAWLREFFDRIAQDSVKAPPEQMLAWSKAENRLYSTLQRSAPAECAAMTMGEWIYVDDSNIVVTRAIAERNVAMVRASAAGRDNPQDYAEPDDGDFNRLGEAIAGTGLAPELQAALGSDAQMQSLSEQDQCAIGVAVYAGLEALPDDIEPEMAAYMLAPVG